MTPTPGIYEPLMMEGYELCQPISSADFETIRVAVNGVSRQTSWKPIAMQLIREDEGTERRQSDSPWFGSDALVFKRRAVEALGDMLRQYGELLPLACADAELSIYNPTRVIDALDEEASELTRFSSSGKIMMIRRHVFRPAVIKNVDIFKISNVRVSSTFLSHRFVERWNASGLKGLEFTHVWSPPN